LHYHQPEVGIDDEPDSEHGPGDGLDGGLDVDERHLEGRLLHVGACLDVVQHQPNVLRVHLAEFLLKKYQILASSPEGSF
jgi:hypothetical protein